MSLGFKAVSLISAIGGCAGVPWLLKKINEQNQKASVATQREEEKQIPDAIVSPRVTRELTKLVPAEELKKAETTIKENCQVIDISDWNNVLFDLNITSITYIPVLCKDTSSDTSDKIPNEWKGLFPDFLFVNVGEFNKGKQFDMTTETTVLGDNTQTVFRGSKLHSPVLGEWEGEMPIFRGDEMIQAQPISFSQPQSGQIFLFLTNLASL